MFLPLAVNSRQNMEHCLGRLLTASGKNMKDCLGTTTIDGQWQKHERLFRDNDYWRPVTKT
jgi:hypothetical protein